MGYAVKEIFFTLQGEGANVGTPAVFCRFAGCNLWTGREEDRASAVCTFCVSPKAGTDLVLSSGDELKLIFPQEMAVPEQFENLAFRHFFLQPMDGVRLAENTRLAVDYCLAHPRWRLSLQTHKILGLM